MNKKKTTKTKAVPKGLPKLKPSVAPETKKLVLSKEERETIILFDESSKECTIYTVARPTMTKLDKLCKSNPNDYKLKHEDKESKTYITTKNLISFRTSGKKRVMTDEQKKIASERMKKMHSKKEEKEVT